MIRNQKLFLLFVLISSSAVTITLSSEQNEQGDEEKSSESMVQHGKDKESLADEINSILKHPEFLSLGLHDQLIVLQALQTMLFKHLGGDGIGGASKRLAPNVAFFLRETLKSLNTKGSKLKEN